MAQNGTCIHDSAQLTLAVSPTLADIQECPRKTILAQKCFGREGDGTIDAGGLLEGPVFEEELLLCHRDSELHLR